jgi:tetratricopeptide (TPR) repeat protein
LTEASALFEQSLAIFQQENETEGSAFSCYGLGLIALKQGDYAPATTHLHESLRLWQLRSDRHYIAAAHCSLGWLALAQADAIGAAGHFCAGLTLYKEMVDKLGAASALEGMANCIQPAALGVQLLGAAQTLRQTIGAPVPPIDQGAYSASINALRTALGAETFAAGWAEGSTLTYEQAIALALSACR